MNTRWVRPLPCTPNSIWQKLIFSLAIQLRRTCHLPSCRPHPNLFIFESSCALTCLNSHSSPFNFLLVTTRKLPAGDRRAPHQRVPSASKLTTYVCYDNLLWVGRILESTFTDKRRCHFFVAFGANPSRSKLCFIQFTASEVFTPANLHTVSRIGSHHRAACTPMSLFFVNMYSMLQQPCVESVHIWVRERRHFCPLAAPKVSAGTVRGKIRRTRNCGHYPVFPGSLLLYVT